jgi:tRNA(Ile)-lysidine synthase TilS/MesJ
MPRNRVRNELLPLLQRRYQPALAKTVLRLMEIVGAEADLVGETARQWLRLAPHKFGRADLLVRPGRAAARPYQTEIFESLARCGSTRALQLQLSEAACGGF